jgi:hypothetical protein
MTAGVRAVWTQVHFRWEQSGWVLRGGQFRSTMTTGVRDLWTQVHFRHEQSGRVLKGGQPRSTMATDVRGRCAQVRLYQVQFYQVQLHCDDIRQRRRLYCWGSVGEAIEDSGKTLGDKTVGGSWVGWQPFEPTEPHGADRRQPATRPVPRI